jgi:hypothetical protein
MSDKKGLIISHSAIEKYKTCPAMYKLHYIDKIRSDKIGSALLFGNALDITLNCLLAIKLVEPTEDACDDIDKLKNLFDQNFTYQMINKELEDVRTSHFIDYYSSDFDPYVLRDDDYTSLERFIRNAGYEDQEVFDLYDTVSSKIKNKTKINSVELSYYNYCSWLSLRRKAHLMLEHYKEEIMPEIIRVHSIQRKVELPNADGDIYTGCIDFEAEMRGHEGIITMDNKTSSRPYKIEDIQDEKQLLGYDEFTQNGKGGYIVLLKKMKYNKSAECIECGSITERPVRSCPETLTGKMRCGGELVIHREPYVQHQILVDNINNEKKDLHFEEICGIIDNIEQQKFEENRDSCFQYGKKCIYYDYCRSNKNKRNTKGLALR